MTTDVARVTPDPVTADPLRPLRAALLAAARDDAGRSVRAAESAAGERLVEARASADGLLAEARTRGESEAATLVAAEAAAAQRAARRVVLTAQREVYDRLRTAAGMAVRDLLTDDATRARLAATLRSRLGGDAEVAPTPDGGLRATAADGRAVDASVATLVDLALDTLDGEALWSTP